MVRNDRNNGRNSKNHSKRPPIPPAQAEITPPQNSFEQFLRAHTAHFVVAMGTLVLTTIGGMLTNMFSFMHEKTFEAIESRAAKAEKERDQMKPEFDRLRSENSIDALYGSDFRSLRFVDLDVTGPYTYVLDTCGVIPCYGLVVSLAKLPAHNNIEVLEVMPLVPNAAKDQMTPATVVPLSVPLHETCRLSFELGPHLVEAFVHSRDRGSAVAAIVQRGPIRDRKSLFTIRDVDHRPECQLAVRLDPKRKVDAGDPD